MKAMPPASMTALLSRRSFLKVGLAGSVLLFAGRWLTVIEAAETSTSNLSLRYLSSADVAVLRHIIPIMLEGALPNDEVSLREAIDEIISGVDTTIDYQPPSVRKEISDLFGILTSGTTRALVAGIWKTWDKTTPDDVRAFLTSWRNSRFDLLRSAYLGLNNLIMGSWYANPRSWSRIGYGGPPKIA